MTGQDKAWICCQLGAREHYAIPSALHSAGALAELVTDFWIDPASLAGGVVPARLRDRFHARLSDASVWSPTLSALAFEARHAVAGTAGWDLILRRNEWFQDRVLERLADFAGHHTHRRFFVFSFSYAARRIFEFAKAREWTTVLGQIDPGPPEERLVIRLHEEHPTLAGPWQPAPPAYWESWREECRLADRVIVNSSWSEQALVQEGVAPGKIRTVPLAYDAPADAVSFERAYPDCFTHERPLRALFLGQVNLRKGMAALLDAIGLLRNAPIEFWIVGPLQMSIPADALTSDRVRWMGSVPRGEAARYYREADVLLFPTCSDGFGLTQLEAQAWKLPVIASRFCGRVVQDGVNGILLPEVTADAIVSALTRLVAQPRLLSEFARHSDGDARFDVVALAARLLELEPA